MRVLISICVLIVMAIAIPTRVPLTTSVSAADVSSERRAGPPDNVVLRWNSALLQAVRHTGFARRIGNVTAAAVIDFRHHDGSNQLGDINGGAPYSDYTGYAPVNSPDRLTSVDRWQPLRGADGVVQTFQAPHWGHVTPFAEYTSGHSAFSAASAKVLTLMTGSRFFGGSFTFKAGASTIEPGAVPATDITLRWRTFDEAANQAGLSRRLGGIHFRHGDLESRLMGRHIGVQAWLKALTYF